jgi:septum site-determining protein MinD
MTRSVVLASGKGGVGKTTLAANLAVALAWYGKRVAVLDADIVMANLEIVLGLKNPPVSLMDVLQGTRKLEEVLYEGPAGVKIIPAGITLDGFHEKNIRMLKAVLREAPDTIEILIIDAPAGRDAAMVMDEGQEVVLVTTPDVASVSDALKMKILAERMGATVYGGVLNRVEGRKRELRPQAVERALDVPLLSIIPEDGRVKEALSDETPFVLKYPDCRPSRELWKIASGLIGRDYRPQPVSLLSKLSDILKRGSKSVFS